MKVAGVLHTHTTNSDGSLRPKELINLYYSYGFDFVAITDHNYITQVPSDLPEDFIVLKGFEDSEGKHIIRLEDDEIAFACHPKRYGESKRDVEKFINKFRLDGAEKYNRGNKQYHGHISKIEFSNDDLHRKNMIGKSWNEVDIGDQEFNKDVLIKNISNGDVNAKRGKFKGVPKRGNQESSSEEIQMQKSGFRSVNRILEGVPESYGENKGRSNY